MSASPTTFDRGGDGETLAGARGKGLARSLWRAIPRAGKTCFLVAFVNAAIWGIVVPPFQVPDEVIHFAYAQYLAEHGRPPPQRAEAQYSPQEQRALEALNFFQVIGHPQARGVITSGEDRGLRAVLATNPSPDGPGGSTSVTNQPPLYYALEAIPYWLSPSSNILTRLVFMRLLSALMAAFTVLAIFMFLREMLPRSPWAWTVGALAVAFQPMFNFIAAGVQADNLLYLASAATFLALARAYRHGLSRRRALAIGLAVVAGLLGKLTFVALIPGIVLAVLLLGWRDWRRGRTQALGDLAIIAAVVLIPVALYAVLNAGPWERGGPTAGGFAGAATAALPAGHAVTLHETIDYIWQLYLPRLPFMHHTEFVGYPLIGTWLNGTVGHFGWLDYTFPAWVYRVAKVLLVVLAALGVLGLIRSRAAIRPLLGLLGCFLVMAIGLLVAIGYSGIRYRASTGYAFEQARYLFPLLSLYAGWLVLAAKGTGRRWAPVIGGLLVVLAMAHGLFAETLTISRYYG